MNRKREAMQDIEEIILGADAYVTMPKTNAALHWRLRAWLKRFGRMLRKHY